MSEQRIFETGISSEYVSHWTVVEALREVLQNWYDVRKEFGCKGSQAWCDGKATLIDRGPGIQPRHLALGISEKAEGSIGQFGEGLKLAMLVLLREGRTVKISSGLLDIEPILINSPNYEVEVLAFKVTARSHKFQGTVIFVECDEEELREANEFFEVYLEKSPNFEWIEPGKLSQLASVGGKIFVNGSVIAEVRDAEFNYHLKTSDKRLVNRDRSAVELSALKSECAALLSRGVTKETAERILGAALKDTFENTLPTWGFIPSTWIEAFESRFGKEAVLAVRNKHDELAEYHGYRPVDLGFNFNGLLERLGVDTSTQRLMSEQCTAAAIPLSRLSESELRNLEIAEELVGQALGIELDVSIRSSLIAPNSHSNPDGQYQPGRKKILIARRVLSDLKGSVETLLHEGMHQKSGFGDISLGFEAALVNQLTELVMKEMF